MDRRNIVSLGVRQPNGFLGLSSGCEKYKAPIDSCCWNSKNQDITTKSLSFRALKLGFFGSGLFPLGGLNFLFPFDMFAQYVTIVDGFFPLHLADMNDQCSAVPILIDLEDI